MAAARISVSRRRVTSAGVRRVVQLGSYYHQVMPYLIKENAYVRARHLADEGARALATADFNVSTLNPPSIVGDIHGVGETFQRQRPGEQFIAIARNGRGDLGGDDEAAGSDRLLELAAVGFCRHPGFHAWNTANGLADAT